MSAVLSKLKRTLLVLRPIVLRIPYKLVQDYIGSFKDTILLHNEEKLAIKKSQRVN